MPDQNSARYWNTQLKKEGLQVIRGREIINKRSGVRFDPRCKRMNNEQLREFIRAEKLRRKKSRSR